MSFIFNKTERLVESDYREKPYFSDHQEVMTFKDKCFVCVLAVLGCLFTMNMFIYSTMQNVIN